MDTASTTGAIPEGDDEKQRKARLAAQKRAKIMAQMAAMQNQFMKENAKLFEEAQAELASSNTNLGGSAMDITEKLEEQPVCIGPRQTLRINTEKTYTCILCQETQKLTVDGPVLVLAGFVQQATVLSLNRNEETAEIFIDNPLYLSSNRGAAPHTSTCGHVMHAACWQKYFDNVMVKEHRRPYRLRHPASFDVDKQEFLCPLCECLSNTVLPLIPPLSSMQGSSSKSEINFANWLACMIATVSKKIKVCLGTCSDSCVNLHCNTCENAAAAADAAAATVATAAVPAGGNGTANTDNNEAVVDCEAACNTPKHQISFSCPYEHVTNELGEHGEEFISLFSSSSPELNSELIEMIQLFIQAPYTRGLNVNPHPSDRRLAPMTWKSLSYTLHTIETLLRDSNKPLLGHLSSRHRDCLESLIRITAVLGGTWKQKTDISSHALCLLSMLIDHHPEDCSILQWDSLGMLVSLTFSLPSLFSKCQPIPIPSGGTLELHTLHLIFVAHIVKLLIITNIEDCNDLTMSMETNETEDQRTMETDANENSEILDILKLLNKHQKVVNLETIWKHIQSSSLPFLRCCVLFYHFLTDVPPMTELTQARGDTFENMCTYLGLPQTPRELFKSAALTPIIEKWCRHYEVTRYLAGDLPAFSRIEPQIINQLVELPSDYSELINTVSSFTCPNSDHEDSRNPTMCLVCGEILCSQSYCCQTELNKTIVGACNYHAYKCGAGVGIFLRVRECEILFLASPLRGCFVSPPYLDDYGETDQGLRRGNPLRLCTERYKKLHTLWLSHSIHEEIARAIESSNNIVGTQWQHL